MDAPEKIALRWELGAAVTNGPLMTHPDYTQFTRADLCAEPALLAEAVEVLRAITALDDTAECCGHGVCGGYSPPECCGQPLYGLDRAKNAATAFLSKLENRHDR